MFEREFCFARSGKSYDIFRSFRFVVDERFADTFLILIYGICQELLELWLGEYFLDIVSVKEQWRIHPG